MGLKRSGCLRTNQLRVLRADLGVWRASTYAAVRICARFKAKKCPWGAKLYLAPATFHSPYWRANDALGLGLRVDGRKSAKKTRCGEMVTKTAILGGFRRVGEIWVAALEHFGSVKRSLRAGPA